MLPAVVPAPVSLASRPGGAFRLSTGTAVEGDSDAASSLTELIEARTGLTVGSAATTSSPAGVISLRVETGGRAESYRLTAGRSGVQVVGADAAGLFYGVQTLGQLIRQEGDDWRIPAVEIDDAPRFGYRGVMLDVARHFHAVDTVKGCIDRAASLKLNALHLHLSDDQGWRIQLRERPELTERASSTAVGGHAGGFYTRQDYTDIVEYASSRHMIVVPEIDMPGHTHAVGLAYPELVEAPVLSDEILGVVEEFGGGIPTAGTPYEGMAVGFSSLRIHDEATYDFVADVFGELAALTPGPYLHLGGDEALGTAPADFAAFVSRASAIIADLGKTPIAWHEAGAAPGIADTTVGQYWGYVMPTEGMDDKARAFVANGSRLILSPADATYLDMSYPERPELGLTWANGPTSVERAYSWEPSSVIDGIDDTAILGIEAPLWSETVVTASDIDVLAFPRIAAAAEAAWSPPTGAGPLRTWASFRERVGAMGPLWKRLGIEYHPSPEIPWATR
jgi:hexosaminidase